MDWFMKAAEKGYADAQFNVGNDVLKERKKKTMYLEKKDQAKRM